MYRSLTITPANRYVAVSYQSPTFEDLKFFMQRDGKTVTRLEPDEFLLQQTADGNYINLVTKFPLRQEISEHLDVLQAKRFSVLVDCFVANLENLGNGCFVYPGVVLYPSAVIHDDVILHCNSGVGHGVVVEQGCFFSGQVTLCGGVTVGRHSWIGAGTMITDGVTVAPNTTAVARSLIIKDISNSNTMYKKHVTS